MHAARAETVGGCKLQQASKRQRVSENERLWKQLGVTKFAWKVQSSFLVAIAIVPYSRSELWRFTLDSSFLDLTCFAL
jgi:hypothetical protein